MRYIKLVQITLVLMFSAAAFADGFDFEATAGGFYPVLTVSNGPQTLTVTTEGFPDGFVFVGGAIEGIATGMGAQAVVGNQLELLAINGFAPLRFSFLLPIFDITFRYGDNGGDDDDPVTIDAFDAANNLLGTLNGIYPIGQSDSLTLSGSFSGASYFIARTTPGFNNDSIFYEIESYTTSSTVPEPSGLLLMGLGVAAIALRRRR